MHPPFQIDGNFGYTAGLAEMLLQSHEDNTVRLLPALPAAWESGFIKGLKGRGGIVVDLHWSENNLDEAVITARKSISINLVYKDKIIPVSLNPDERYTYKPE